MLNLEPIEGLQSVLLRAVDFAEFQGTETYDPYDFKGSRLVMGLHKRGSLGKAVLKAIYGAAFLAPAMTRNALGVRKQASAGGLAHLAMAYCELHRAGDPKALGKAKLLLEDLEAMRQGPGWGLPFAWQSGVATVPANTPIGHTTMTVGNAFYEYNSIAEDDWSLAQAVTACAFLNGGLPQTETEGGGIALSYTPLDASKCVNSNADSAALLARVGAKAGRATYLDTARKIAHFVVHAQNQDGSWNYLAGVQNGSGSIIDHYHTAMTISALLPLALILFDDACHQSAKSGLEFYLDNLFLASGAPRFATTMDSPIDIYGCAQGLVTLLDCASFPVFSSELKSRSGHRAHQLVRFMMDRMQDSDGSFVYRRYAIGTMRLKSLRWAQALAITGLCRYDRYERGT